MRTFFLPFVLLLFVISYSVSCNRNCTNCNVKQFFSSSDSTLVGYPFEDERDARYCDNQKQQLIESQGTYVNEFTKPNGDKYTITEVLVVKCD